MLDGDQKFFKHGRVDKEALTSFIKNIKKNTNLSDEDAAVMAASKVIWIYCPEILLIFSRL